MRLFCVSVAICFSLFEVSIPYLKYFLIFILVTANTIPVLNSLLLSFYAIKSGSC